MDKKNVFPALVLTAVVALVSACGGGGGGGAAGPGPVGGPPPASGLGELITAPTASPIASFVQNIPSKDHAGPYDEVFPGSANLWSLDTDFSLANGFDDQFVNAESLVDVGGEPFPGDQQFGDTINPAPTFYTPTLGTVDGVVVAKVSDGKSISGSLPTGLLTSVVTGTYAAFLNSTSDSRLQQILDLTSLPTGSVVTITWNDAVWLDQGAIAGYDPTKFPSYQVVLRKMDGTLIPGATLYSDLFSAPAPYTNQIHTRPYTKSGLSDRQIVVLSFEEKNSNFPGGTLLGSGPNNSQSFAIIDNVSARDTLAHQYVKNGTFEDIGTDPANPVLTGWTTNTPAEVQNITSGARTLTATGLTVTRSFFTVPNKLWGRWVDLFTNNTASAITTTVTYETDLGSLGAGIIYDPVSLSSNTTPAPHALTSWDSSAMNVPNLNFGFGTRDIGLVFGNAATVDFFSADGTGVTGDEFIDVTYNITVPAGGSVAIVNFVLMDGTDTGLTATATGNPVIVNTDLSFQAREIDTASKAILSNFWTDDQYRVGMTQQQLDAIKNF